MSSRSRSGDQNGAELDLEERSKEDTRKDKDRTKVSTSDTSVESGGQIE